MQVIDWHPGTPSGNQELLDADTWVKNMANMYKQLINTYPSVVGKLIVDLINVSSSLTV